MGHKLKPSKHAKWSLQIVAQEDAKEVVSGAEPMYKTQNTTANVTMI